MFAAVVDYVSCFRNVERLAPHLLWKQCSYSTWKAEVLNGLVMEITAIENDINDILQTFRQLLLSSSMHYKLNCSDHAASSYWSVRRKSLWKMKNAKGCFGSDVVARKLKHLVTSGQDWGCKVCSFIMKITARKKRHRRHISNVSITPVIIISALQIEPQWSCCKFLLVSQKCYLQCNLSPI